MKIPPCYYEYPRIFHRDVVKIEVDVFVRRVRKRFVEKIRSFKSIELAIPISQDNAVISLIALRVGEIEGRYRTEKNDEILFFSPLIEIFRFQSMSS